MTLSESRLPTDSKGLWQGLLPRDSNPNSITDIFVAVYTTLKTRYTVPTSVKDLRLNWQYIFCFPRATFGESIARAASGKANDFVMAHGCGFIMTCRLL